MLLIFTTTHRRSLIITFLWTSHTPASLRFVKVQHSCYGVYIHSGPVLFSIRLTSLHFRFQCLYTQLGSYSLLTYPILFRIPLNSSEKCHLQHPKSLFFWLHWCPCLTLINTTHKVIYIHTYIKYNYKYYQPIRI